MNLHHQNLLSQVDLGLFAIGSWAHDESMNKLMKIDSWQNWSEKVISAFGSCEPR